jgi:glycosyltransferase involved in cell wall biosynthesis
MNLRLARLRKLFRRGGLQRARVAVVKQLARRYLSVPLDVVSNYQFVFSQDDPPQLRPGTLGKLKINWLLAGITSSQGGLFNIFRTVQQLEAWGHENRICVLGKLPASPAEIRAQIQRDYFPIQAEIATVSDGMRDSDALVATSWPTAYAARSIGNTAAKFYFVQDVEYMFYAAGSMHEFARRTYRFGFHGITAGRWVADVLKGEFGMDCTPFGFSFDRGAYSPHGPRTLSDPKRRVLFYARPETERRGFELGILTLSLVAQKMPDVEIVLVGFPPGSLQLPFRAVVQGVLPLSSLSALYRSCDVALVLSHTNLSLLPLELMASGCAVVSNSGPNTEWLLKDSFSRLAPFDPVLLSHSIVELLQNDRLRAGLVEAALSYVQSTDWADEIKIIESALLSSRSRSKSA